MNNRTLLIIFGLLLVVYLATRLFSGQKDRSFDPNIVQVETDKASKIIMNPKKDEFVDIILEKDSDGSWTISKGALTVPAQQSTVDGLLKQLESIKAKRIIAKKKEKWTDFEVNENQGTRLRVFEGTKKVGDIIVGGFSINQAARSSLTYVRPSDETTVYAVEGFLSMTFGNGFNGFRDKKLFDLNTDEITAVEVNLPNIQYSLLKVGELWQGPEGLAIDTAKITNFINSLNNKQGAGFFDASIEGLNKLGKIVVSTTSGASQSVDLFSNPNGEQPFVLNPSSNPDAYFLSDSTGLFKKLFKPIADFSAEY